MRLALCTIAALCLAGCSSQPPVQPEPRQTPPAQAPPPAPTADSRPAIVCFGDSLTAGFGLDPGQSYPDLLQKEFDRRGDAYRVVNLGNSGDTTQDGLARLSLVLAEKPVLVVLEFGANDGLRGQPVEGTEQNLDSLIRQLQSAGAKVVLAGITLPPNYGHTYIAKFDGIFPELSKRYNLVRIPFLLAGAAGHSNLMQADGLHPNAAGTRLVTRNVFNAIEPLLRP